MSKLCEVAKDEDGWVICCCSAYASRLLHFGQHSDNGPGFFIKHAAVPKKSFSPLHLPEPDPRVSVNFCPICGASLKPKEETSS